MRSGNVTSAEIEASGTGNAAGEVDVDEAVLATIERLTEQTGRRPGRDRIKAHLPTGVSVGSGRLDRLVREHADRAGEALRATSPHLRPVPDRAEDEAGEQADPTDPDRADWQAGDRSGGSGGSADLRASYPTGRAGEQAGGSGEHSDRADPTVSDRAGEAGEAVNPPASDRAGEVSDRSGARAGEAFARLGAAVAEAGESWVRDRAARPVEAGESDRSEAHNGSRVATRVAVIVGLIGTGIVTWTGGVSLATRLGWGPVAVAPGFLSVEVNPAMFLPLAVELVLVVAVHRVSTTAGAQRLASVALASVAFGIALLVQRYAHAATLPEWLGPVIGVVPVLALAMLVALSTIEPRRG